MTDWLPSETDDGNPAPRADASALQVEDERLEKQLEWLRNVDGKPWRGPLCKAVHRYFNNNKQHWTTDLRNDFIENIKNMEINWGLAFIKPSDHRLCRLKKDPKKGPYSRPGFSSALLLLFMFPWDKLKNNKMWNLWEEDWRKHVVGPYPQQVPEFRKYVKEHNEKKNQKLEEEGSGSSISGESSSDEDIPFRSEGLENVRTSRKAPARPSRDGMPSESGQRPATARPRTRQQEPQAEDAHTDGFRDRLDWDEDVPYNNMNAYDLSISYANRAPDESILNQTNMATGRPGLDLGHDIPTIRLRSKKHPSNNHGILDDDEDGDEQARAIQAAGQHTWASPQRALEASTTRQTTISGSQQPGLAGQSDANGFKKRRHQKAFDQRSLLPESRPRFLSNDALADRSVSITSIDGDSRRGQLSGEQGVQALQESERASKRRAGTPLSERRRIPTTHISLQDLNTLINILCQPNTDGAVYRRLFLSVKRAEGANGGTNFVQSVLNLVDTYPGEGRRRGAEPQSGSVSGFVVE